MAYIIPDNRKAYLLSGHTSPSRSKNAHIELFYLRSKVWDIMKGHFRIHGLCEAYAISRTIGAQLNSADPYFFPFYM